MNPEPNRSVVVGVEPTHNGIVVHIARDARFYPDAAVWPIQSIKVPDEVLARISEIVSGKLVSVAAE
ncbi:hypothetical protein [Methylorubrum suomiense]|uniref:Uncharacterized protein n=1 Tax=Methylorubrum suomiense TaxID=144191 RepID=A0ABQ4UZK8_9HYPH|nr:hypothetical protein [Methylorubrum suomiense]GJE77264.1 hypothetical protein BGCPKDLD_3867 [Methylorubrum suomiense]